MSSSLLTDYFIEKASGLIKLEPEVSDHTQRYSMFDDGAVSLEDGEFLYGLVRILKPNQILTTGIYTGISDMYIGQALKDNGFGHDIAFEIENTHLQRAEKLWKLTGVSEWITGNLQSSLDFSPIDQYDFIFLDSEPGIRFQELEKFFPHLNPGGYIFIHDLHRHLSQMPHDMFFGWPYSQLPDIIEEWIKTDQLRVISFPTPRGLSAFYKPTDDDYRHSDPRFKPVVSDLPKDSKKK